MVERDNSSDHFLSDPKSTKFIRTSEKIRNPKIGDDVAWDEFQDILTTIIPEYPEQYKCVRSALRRMFNYRRAALLGRIDNVEASERVKDIYFIGLQPREQDLIALPLKVITDALSRPEYRRVLLGRKRAK